MAEVFQNFLLGDCKPAAQPKQLQPTFRVDIVVIAAFLKTSSESNSIFDGVSLVSIPPLSQFLVWAMNWELNRRQFWFFF